MLFEICCHLTKSKYSVAYSLACKCMPLALSIKAWDTLPATRMFKSDKGVPRATNHTLPCWDNLANGSAQQRGNVG